MLTSAAYPRKKKGRFSLIPIEGAVIKSEQSSAVGDDAPVRKVNERIQRPQPIDKPTGLLGKKNVRISEQESYRLNDSLESKREASKKEAESSGASKVLSDDLPRDAVTLDGLKQAWKLFADAMNESGKRSLNATLTLFDPVLEGETIHFKVANRVQEEDLRLIRVEMMEFIRKRLNNHHLQLTVHLAETGEQKLTFLSERDKYEQMVKKNPALEELRKRLDLDLRQ